MTMRLNLEHILQSQLADAPQPNDHQLAVPTTKEKAHLRLGAGRSPAYRYFSEKADVKSRIHSMMANIHQHMKTTAPPRKAVPAVPAAIAEMPVPPSSSKGNLSKKSRRIKGGGGGVVSGSKSTMMPLAQMKARLSRQSQQVMRRGFSDMSPKTFTNQKRIREVLLQKTVLENMLLQHKRLQRDRQTIAMDIQRMRQDLDRIKNKLDTSLQALNSTKTLYSGFMKGKKSILPISLPVATTTATAVVSRPKVMAKISFKPVATTTKRSQSTTSKRRSRR